ncbi:hypothetical protein MBH78_06025 [Oceanimonas sp. NS1]|nr:hypothetical protein [Oceanimonas sp. NS1]
MVVSELGQFCLQLLKQVLAALTGDLCIGLMGLPGAGLEEARSSSVSLISSIPGLAC